jgi:hypothetical protein
LFLVVFIKVFGSFDEASACREISDFVWKYDSSSGLVKTCWMNGVTSVKSPGMTFEIESEESEESDEEIVDSDENAVTSKVKNEQKWNEIEGKKKFENIFVKIL